MTRRLSRSEIMSRIRSRNTKPELLLRRALWAKGCRYRLHYDLPGHPDLAFLRDRVAVFVDGCFWHGCPLHYSAPRTREDFWKSKLRRNVFRDLATDDSLISDGWHVVHVWEHELGDIEGVVRHILGILGRGGKNYHAGMVPATTVSEAAAQYGSIQDHEPWWRCHCGSSDVRILALSGHGSLRPNARKRPESAELICRACRHVWTARPCQFS